MFLSDDTAQCMAKALSRTGVTVNPCNLPWGLFTKDQLRQPARRVLLHPEIPWKNITLPPFPDVPDGGLSRDGTTPVGAAVDFTFL